MTSEAILTPVLAGLRVLEIGHFVAAPFALAYSRTLAPTSSRSSRLLAIRSGSGAT
jgi:hypothetical protein